MKTLGLIKIGLAVVALAGLAHGGDITDITCDCGKNSGEPQNCPANFLNGLVYRVHHGVHIPSDLARLRRKCC